MAIPASMQAQNSKIGTCPHGLPIGACPICNGMGSGGANRRDVARNPGEMTWNQCAAIGAMMKAQKARKLAMEADMQRHLQMMAKFEQNMEAMVKKFAQLASFFTAKTPSIISKPINFILNNVVIGTLNFIKNLPLNISQTIAVINQKIADISDKIAAVYGEIKTAIEKKISEFSNNIKKKLKSIFSIFGANNSENEEKKIEDEKRVFELKTFIHKLYQKISKNKKDNINDVES